MKMSNKTFFFNVSMEVTAFWSFHIDLMFNKLSGVDATNHVSVVTFTIIDGYIATFNFRQTVFIGEIHFNQIVCP